MKKGDIHESDSSFDLHHLGVPALISSLVLRSQNLGQVDVAYLQKSFSKSWVLYLIEVKSSQYPTVFQMKRLRRTQDYLSQVLEMPAKLEVKFCKKGQPTLSF